MFHLFVSLVLTAHYDERDLDRLNLGPGYQTPRTGPPRVVRPVGRLWIFDKTFGVLGPNGNNNDCITGGNNGRWNEKKGYRHQRHVQLPLPRLFQLDPTLHFVLNRVLLVQNQHRYRKQYAEEPRGRY
jgi:hypothetical protein